MKFAYSFSVIFLCFMSIVAGAECVDVDLWGKPHTFGPNSELTEHPCGGIKTICLEIIAETEAFEPSWVYEISDDNKVISNWPIPVDGGVYALENSNVIVAFPNYKKTIKGNAWEFPNFVKINTKGEVKAYQQIERQYKDAFICPDIKDAPEIKGMWCFKFHDKDNERIIAVPSVCS